MMSSRDPALLHPVLRERWEWLRDEFISLYPERPTPELSQTYRNREDQEAAFNAGKSRAHFGESLHNFDPAFAFDIFFEHNGEADWSWTNFSIFGRLAEGIGLEWGGRWDSLRDGPHIQLPMSIADAKNNVIPALVSITGEEWRLIIMKNKKLVQLIQMPDTHTMVQRIDAERNRIWVDVRRKDE